MCSSSCEMREASEQALHLQSVHISLCTFQVSATSSHSYTPISYDLGTKSSSYAIEVLLISSTELKIHRANVVAHVRVLT
jgi:hypothetical protein